MRVSSPVSGLVAHTYPPPTASPYVGPPISTLPAISLEDGSIFVTVPASALVTQMAPSPKRTSRGLASTVTRSTTLRSAGSITATWPAPLAATQRNSPSNAMPRGPPFTATGRPVGRPLSASSSFTAPSPLTVTHMFSSAAAR